MLARNARKARRLSYEALRESHRAVAAHEGLAISAPTECPHTTFFTLVRALCLDMGTRWACQTRRLPQVLLVRSVLAHDAKVRIVCTATVLSLDTALAFCRARVFLRHARRAVEAGRRPRLGLKLARLAQLAHFCRHDLDISSLRTVCAFLFTPGICRPPRNTR